MLLIFTIWFIADEDGEYHRRRISITELSAHLEGHGEEMRRIAELEARMGPSARDIPLQQREDAATIMQQQFPRLA